jgi:hypothetical protein
MCWNIRSKTVNIRQTHQILLSRFRRHFSTLYGHLQAFLWNKSLNCCVHLWDPMNAYKGQCVNYLYIIKDTMSNFFYYYLQPKFTTVVAFGDFNYDKRPFNLDYIVRFKVFVVLCSLLQATGNGTHTPTPHPLLRETSHVPLCFKLTPKVWKI